MRTALFVILALASTAAMADGPKQGAQGGKLICRAEADTGTRLGGHRVCLTRDQWAERKRHDREGAERAQTGQMNRSGG